MLMIRKALFLILLLAISACEKKSEEKVNYGRDSLKAAIEDSNRVISQNGSEIPKNAPDWYRHFPEAEGYLYVAANAHSKNAAVAEEKAIHLARVLMAQMCDSNDQGKSDTLQQNLRQSIVLKKTRIKSNNQWQAFVLLRMKKKD